MKSVKVVIGANFGDEGKGLMTNYFCLQNKEQNILNVRFNGTCQAGHTVVDGEKRHIFSHFGSGSFNYNVTTYLSSYFYVNPIIFNSEYQKLTELGVRPKVKIAQNASVILIFDVLYNRYIENYRSKNRHGSCGLGLWESWLREQYREDNFENYLLTVNDLQKGRIKLFNRIKEIRDNYFSKKFEKDNLPFNENLQIEDIYWKDDKIIELYIEECKKMLSLVDIVDEKDILNEYEYIVFEGAQGLLLDWGNREYMPNLTASRTGLTNVISLVDLIEDEVDFEVCYVTRSYFTRHGVGKFLSEVKNKEILGVTEVDKTNFKNLWQGSLRYGYFDYNLFIRTIYNDLVNIKNSKKVNSEEVKKSICVSHLDETNNKIKLNNMDIDMEDFVGLFNDDWLFYSSYSEDSRNIKVL